MCFHDLALGVLTSWLRKLILAPRLPVAGCYCYCSCCYCNHHHYNCYYYYDYCCHCCYYYC